nr:hypothetical protein [Tanacetum cinerariifolium]
QRYQGTFQGGKHFLSKPTANYDGGIEPQQLKELEQTLEDELQDLHLNLPVLEVLDHASIYNAILGKYVKSLELGKNGSAFFQGEVPTKMEDLKLFTLSCRLWDSKPFDTLADLGSCVNIIPLYLFKKLNIRLLEETDHIFRLADESKSYPVRIVKDVELLRFDPPIIVCSRLAWEMFASLECALIALIEMEGALTIRSMMAFNTVSILLVISLCCCLKSASNLDSLAS